MSETIEFAVENAGCESCAERVRAALTPFAAVDRIDVDEAADRATVRVTADGDLDAAAVDAALAEASEGSGGHEYRIAAGTWSRRG